VFRTKLWCVSNNIRCAPVDKSGFRVGHNYSDYCKLSVCLREWVAVLGAISLRIIRSETAFFKLRLIDVLPPYVLSLRVQQIPPNTQGPCSRLTWFRFDVLSIGIICRISISISFLGLRLERVENPNRNIRISGR